MFQQGAHLADQPVHKFVKNTHTKDVILKNIFVSKSEPDYMTFDRESENTELLNSAFCCRKSYQIPSAKMFLMYSFSLLKSL